MFGIRELKIKVEKLACKLEDNERLIEFLLENDRNDCVVKSKFNLCGWYDVIEYVDSGKLCDVKLPRNINGDDLSIIENNKESALFEMKRAGLKTKYYKLDKSQEMLFEITDLKEKFENQEKVSENLKQSAEAFGNSLKDIFESFKSNDNKKCDKEDCKCKSKKSSNKKGAKKND